MRNWMSCKILYCLAIWGFTLSSADALAATVTINPVKDNTIAQGIDPGSGENFEDNSSGACENVFAGVTNDGLLRRSLLQFDIAGNVPAGSTINSVTLTMTVNRAGDNQDAAMFIHRVSKLWGEGTATCGPRGGGQGDPAGVGDATWLDAEFNITSWATAGGDYGTASASAVVGSGNGSQGVWVSTANPAMIEDIQDWLDNPAANFGWILIGDEARNSTTRRFSSREGTVPPALQIDFTPTGDVFACCYDDGTCGVQLTTDCTASGGTPDTNTDTCEPNPCPQPVGACCNLDESCSDIVDRLTCEFTGGTFQGAGSTCSQASVDCGLTPFVDALPIPPVLQPTGTRADGVPQYTVDVISATQQLHAELPGTNLWTYNSAYPSFTIEATKDQPIEVTYLNSLPTKGRRGGHILDVDECAHGPNQWADSARVVTHLHGGHLPARFDGQPEYHILPGEIDIYEYYNRQDAATLWYHDHALGITRLNVYAGMAGFYLLRDSGDTGDTSNAFGLPSGEFEIPIVIQDREFNPDGSLFYNPTIQNAFKGDRIVVNGKVWPYLNVKQGKYRFRFLNGSQAREYTLRLENITNPGNDPAFTLIGTDVGLTSAPIDLGNSISIAAPAERFDVVVDFSGFPAGTEIVLRNDELTAPLIPNVMKFIVTNQPGYTGTIAPALRTVTPLDPSEVPTRYFRLKKLDATCSNDPARIVGEWLIESLNGPSGTVIGEHWDDITEYPVLGTREIWEFENPTNSMHPMHVHLVKFQVLDKTDLTTGQFIPLKPWEINTWKDTVRVPGRSKVRIIMDFQDYLGKFPFHCHILDHEDHEMMRQFQTTNDPANRVIDGVCGAGEDCISNPEECLTVSGALCGNGLCEAGDGENCVTCPEDCAGRQQGPVSNQYCCGFNDGQVTNPVGCGIDVNDDRCINRRNNLYCREAPRVSACCGDNLCEGQETEANCAVDCAACTPTGISETLCNGTDDDCDYIIDEDAPVNTYYRDADGDGFGDSLDTIQACSPPQGYVTDNTDCDDAEPEVYPGGPPVKVVGLASTTYHPGLQGGYNAAEDTDNILIKAETLTESIDFNHENNISVTIHAGYDCSYSANTGGKSVISGSMIATSGTVTIGSGTLEVQ
ncbi:MAG: multicopper oxidase family protein [Nitrospiraceae bacterium]|nr:MAG: multicopper oxidase family protein [Nitrospiraceae bacterium]